MHYINTASKQLAFSYETLVEDGDSECTGDGFDDHGNDHSYLLHVARIFDAEQDFHRLLSGEGHGDKNYSSMAGDREIYYTDNICCYDRRRRLRSARRFRLLNLRVPLTSKLYRGKPQFCPSFTHIVLIYCYAQWLLCRMRRHLRCS